MPFSTAGCFNPAVVAIAFAWYLVIAIPPIAVRPGGVEEVS
jgi:hypothetical protein